MSTQKNSHNKPKISHFLGIDHGEADVGFALADAETRMAFAYRTLRNDKLLIQEVSEIVADENVSEIVIGIPSHVNLGKIKYSGEKLGKILEEKLKIPVHYQNEMFTTKMAQDNLIKKGVKGVKRYDDQEAARIILQEWLDRE